MFSQVSFSLDVSTAVTGIIFLALCWVGKRYGSAIWEKVNGVKIMTALTALSVCGFGAWGVNEYHHSKLFDSEFAGYVLAAHGAEDAETAEKYMERAVRWIDKHGATNGPEQTAVIYESPDCNVHDWARMVLGCYEGVQHAAQTSSPNRPVNFREKLAPLVKANSDGTLKVVAPPNISMYPENQYDLLAFVLTLAGTAIFGTSAVAMHLRKKKPAATASAPVAAPSTTAAPAAVATAPPAAKPAGMCEYCGKVQHKPTA